MDNIQFEVTCPYCDQIFLVSSQAGIQVQCQCPNCQQDLIVDAPIVDNCALPESDFEDSKTNSYQSVTNYSQQAPPETNKYYTRAFCSNCGNELRVGAKFCPKCGTKVAFIPPSPSSPSPSPSSSSYTPVRYNPNSDENQEENKEEYEELSGGMKFVIFLLWPVGFSVYFSNWVTQPIKAHSAIKWASYGFWVTFIANLIYVFLFK